MATFDVAPTIAVVTASFVKMSSHALPTVNEPQQHYTGHSFDWQSLFDKLDCPAPTPSLRAVAAAHGIPRSTLSYHYRSYKAALANGDKEKLAVARGEIAGQRDNHRVFSRAEEKELLTELDKENIHPNKPVVQPLARRIHEAMEAKTGPADSTRSQLSSTTPFKAGGSFVERIKRESNHNDHKPKLVKRLKRSKNLRRRRSRRQWPSSVRR